MTTTDTRLIAVAWALALLVLAGSTAAEPGYERVLKPCWTFGYVPLVGWPANSKVEISADGKRYAPYHPICFELDTPTPVYVVATVPPEPGITRLPSWSPPLYVEYIGEPARLDPDGDRLYGVAGLGLLFRDANTPAEANAIYAAWWPVFGLCHDGKQVIECEMDGQP